MHLNPHQFLPVQHSVNRYHKFDNACYYTILITALLYLDKPSNACWSIVRGCQW